MRRNIERRLAAITEELSALRAEVGILHEQLAFASDVLEETRVRALVAETPLAEREFRVASEDVRRIERVVVEADGRVAALLEERDRLLEAMSASLPQVDRAPSGGTNPKTQAAGPATRV